jgi:hypothetical protein
MKTGIICCCLLVASLTVGAQPQNVQISKPGGYPEEVSIAINPKNPDNLIAGANLRYVYASTDGGLTWTESQLPYGTYGDPCIIFDADGRAYYAHLTMGWDAITVRISDDGGTTWPKTVKLFGPSSDSARPGSLENSSLQDKEWLIADMTNGPHHGNIYASWTDFTKYGSEDPRDSSVIVFARSTDRGETFEKWVRVSDKAGDAIDSDNTMEGAVPAVGPGGEVYLAWAGPDGLYFDRSFDAGATWGRDSVLTALPGGWDFNVGGLSRANGLPITLADISSSPFRGTVYINWVDHRNGDPDVFLMKSTDRGNTWSAPKRVNDDTPRNGKVQFFTWAAVDPVSGEIVVVYYDRRRYATDSTDVYIARSTDGGETFRNECISSSAFLPSAMSFMGDYNCVSVYNGRIRPIWTRLQTGKLSIHTAIIDGTTGIDGAKSSQPEGYLLQHFPNPLDMGRSGTTTIRFTLPRECMVTLTVHDFLGHTVATLLKERTPAGDHSVRYDAASLSAGTYCCRMVAEAGDATGSSVVRSQLFTLTR